MALDWNKLIDERNAWIAHNFPHPHIDDPGESVMGVLEEAGELIHAVLKQAQNIRGTGQEHADAARDAVGDITIYALGIMSFCEFKPLKSKPSMHVRPTVFSVGASAGAMCFIYDNKMSRLRYHQHLVNLIHALEGFCVREGWNYEEIVNETWARVSKRDWIADPTTGGE